MSSCSCVYVNDDNCDPDFIEYNQYRARKEHQCTECQRTIGKGEEYEYVSGKWAMGFAQYKTCADCLSVREAFFCKGYVFGGVWEYLAEHIAEGPVSASCIAALTPAAREQVCDLIEESWGNED